MTCSTALNLIADKTIKGRIYPSLATHEARPYTQSWREFGQHWPYTTPVRLQEYCQQHGVEINIFNINDVLPENTYYPICLGFFDFNIDYIGLLPKNVFDRTKAGDLQILFMYHEGDNPRVIKQRLDSLCDHHGLARTCYIFVSSNTAADSLPGFVTFHDFELWYYQRNLETPSLKSHCSKRDKDFTVLSRLHKSWRAAAMADLQRNKLLENSYWSYCEIGEYADDSPIEIDLIPQLRWATMNFLKSGPYFADELSQDQRNDHSLLESKFFTNSYCNIVLESQFDVDQSNGAFITEKTFKPIKHGQLFFIAGAARSLQALRDLGYKTFDSLIDNSYDLEVNHTLRWRKLVDSIKQAKSNLQEISALAYSEIVHNQQLFAESKANRLNTLIRKINEQHR